MKRGDFFRGVWLSPLAFIKRREAPTPGSSTIDAQRNPALAQVLPTTPEMLNVTAFGAVGDGNADDTGPIEAAINVSGGTVPVYFPHGTYKVTRQLVLTVTAYSLVGSRTEKTGGEEQATTINYRPTSALGAMISITTTDTPTGNQGPFEHVNLRFDCDDGVYDQGLFKFGDEATATASQRNTFGIRFDKCYLNGKQDTRVSTAAGVLPRSGQIMVHLTQHYETVFENCRLIGGDVQVRSYAGDKPVFNRCRSVYANLPFEFEGDPADGLYVQHSMIDVQIEGWALTPISVKDCHLAASHLRIENTDASFVGMGWFTLPAITVAGTKNTGALTFSVTMDDILFPGVSIIKISEGANEHTALVKAVSGTAVTIETDRNVLLWTAVTATVKRLHGYGPLHNSIFDSTFSGVSIVTSLNSPAFVYHVSDGMMMIVNAVETFGAGGNNQASLVIGNKHGGTNYLDSHMVFSNCQPYVVADPGNPFVIVSNIRSDYGGRPHPEVGRTAFRPDKGARMGDLFYEQSLIRRTWAWSPKSFTHATGMYALPMVSVAGEDETRERIWCWDTTPSFYSSSIPLTDESLPSASGSLRLSFKVKGSDARSVFRWRTIGDGSGFTNVVTLTGEWQIIEAFFQTIPAEWATGGNRDDDVGIEVLTPTTTGFYLAAVVVEELPLFQTTKIVTLTDARTIEIDAALGGKYTVTLTAARAMAAPMNPAIGQEIEFDIRQGGTGRWDLTWNAVFRQAWSDSRNRAGRRSTIRFYYDGTNWVQMGAQSPYL
jgi:hypothetical protein